jgi:hypothetical protein
MASNIVLEMVWILALQLLKYQRSNYQIYVGNGYKTLRLSNAGKAISYALEILARK